MSDSNHTPRSPGETLRAYREEHLKVSQEAFADQLDVTRQYVNALECGRKSPSLSLSMRIDKATKGAVTAADWWEWEQSGGHQKPIIPKEAA